jgi:hypothetical protein
MMNDSHLRNRILMSSTPTITDEILAEDGAEGAFKEVAEDVESAEALILTILAEDGGVTWSMREIMAEVQKRDEELASMVISIAFMRLSDAGKIVLDPYLRAKAA